MKPPVDGSPEWLAERRTGIGASDIAAVAGLSRYRSPFDVYLDKIGQAAPPAETAAMHWGHLLEPVVAREWAERHQVRIRRHRAMIRHPQHPWAYAHLDFEVPGAILEIKTAGHYAADQWGEDGTDMVPPEYMMQVQWQLACTGRPVGYLAALIGAHTYHDYIVPRDQDVIDSLLVIGEAFWERVQSRTPPDVDGSPAAARYLAQRFPRAADDELLVDRGDPIVGTVERLLTLQADIAEKDAEIRALTNAIKERMGEAGAMRGPRFRVTWRNVKGGTYTVTRPDYRRFTATAVEE